MSTASEHQSRSSSRASSRASGRASPARSKGKSRDSDSDSGSVRSVGGFSNSGSDSDSDGQGPSAPRAIFPPQSGLSPRRQPAPVQLAPGPTAMGGGASGRYMPPALKRQMLAVAAAASSSAEQEQRESWEILKKRINGPVNKVNTANIKDIVVELFSANLIRGRGLFCRSIMRAQSLSSSYTPVYAALVAVINTKLPIVGELLIARLVLQFRRAFNRDDKDRCISTAMFLAHLTNQRIAHEVLAFQVVSLLLETPTDDSVEVAVAFMREVGAFLTDVAPRVLNAVFDTFRSILHESDIDKRVQYMIEVLFQVRRDGFKDSPVIPEGLDLVDEDEQIVHEVALDDDDLDAQDELNVFQLDDNFSESESKYNSIKREILGEDDSDADGSDNGGGESGTESDNESGSDSGSDSEAESESEMKAAADKSTGAPGVQKIHDLTETELVNLRRTIYLTIMSSLSFEEAAHKLLKIEIRPGEEQELCNMVIECCSQERTYKNFFGLIGERLCKLNRAWYNGFVLAFASCYENIHRYETNHLRNIAHFFSHLLATDALHWSVLQAVVLTEEATTSSSRIFLKILLQDLAEELGLKTLNEKLKSTDLRVSEAVKGMFPSDSAKTTRFAINYYTSIGLGAITEEMREWLKSAPTLTAANGSDSDSDSDSSSSSGSESHSSGSSSGPSSGSGSDSDSSSSSCSSSGSSASSRTISSRSSSISSRSSRRCSRSRPLKINHERPLSHSGSPDARKVMPAAIIPENPGTIDTMSERQKSPKSPAPIHLERPARRSNSRDNAESAIQPVAMKDSKMRSPSYSPSRDAAYANRSASNIRTRYRSKSPSISASDRESKSMRDLSLHGNRDRSHRSPSRSIRPRSPLQSRRQRSRSRSRYDRGSDRYARDSRRYNGGKRERSRSYSRSRSPSRDRYRGSYSSRSSRRRY
ncbi:pre-mRNA-splicing factor cwc22 [Kickxella alabastrina]|uniref:Pre-mRNA-splicing factor cwc22 n=1 Tax=Kickxella alabastrina TaxID=61397 RepID=A0ACC1IUT8_9FUNG|nr:pre-mRNA-splicing factor cwc22 [Kickxella alabastrina]